MSSVPIADDLRLLQLPSEESLLVSRSVSAGTLAAIADAQNHLVGWRGRRAAHNIFSYPDTLGGGAAGTGGAAFDDPYTKGANTYYIPWRCSEKAEHLQVGITYQSSTVAVDSLISVRLETVGGGPPIIDPIGGVGAAYVHSTEDGTLDTAHRAATYGGAAVITEYPALFTSSGDRVVDVPGAAATTPRCLNIATAYRGLFLAVVIYSSKVRVLSVDVQELWQEMIEQ